MLEFNHHDRSGFTMIPAAVRCHRAADTAPWAGAPLAAPPDPSSRLEHTDAEDQQASLRSRERFWDIRVPKIDSIFDNSLVPRPSWSPGVPPQHRKLVAATHRSPIWLDAAFGCSLGIPFGAFGTSGIPCRLAATGDYPPSLRSPWRAASERPGDGPVARTAGPLTRTPRWTPSAAPPADGADHRPGGHPGRRPGLSGHQWVRRPPDPDAAQAPAGLFRSQTATLRGPLRAHLPPRAPAGGSGGAGAGLFRLGPG